MTIRTRFAPSPTGFLHIGSARTALFCWLYARRMKGTFLLRIEDTDRERSTLEAIDAIFDGMSWLGLESDEAVIFQTQRFERYQEVAETLLAQGKAYRCNCSKERLEKLREEQMQKKLKPRYDGYCREKEISENEHPYVIRFKTPKEGITIVHDKVYGNIEFSNNELDDVILIRSDGVPTYNFSVVVDDWDTRITHVIRGDDHLNNTPRQINILKALNAPIPIYAHVPMILGEDGKKLSKRHGAVSVMHYRDMGILPIAMRNYLARLGWSHGNQEIFSEEDLFNLFDIKDINKSPSALNIEKLLWLNQHYLKSMPEEKLAQELKWHIEDQQVDITQGPPIDQLITFQRDRVKTLRELVEKSIYLYKEPIGYDGEAQKKFLTPETKHVLQKMVIRLEELLSWEKDQLHQVIQELLEELDLKMPMIAQPLRVALTGNVLSPSIDLTLLYIGQTRAIHRIKKAIHFISENYT